MCLTFVYRTLTPELLLTNREFIRLPKPNHAAKKYLGGIIDSEVLIFSLALSPQPSVSDSYKQKALVYDPSRRITRQEKYFFLLFYFSAFVWVDSKSGSVFLKIHQAQLFSCLLLLTVFRSMNWFHCLRRKFLRSWNNVWLAQIGMNTDSSLDQHFPKLWRESFDHSPFKVIRVRHSPFICFPGNAQYAISRILTVQFTSIWQYLVFLDS